MRYLTARIAQQIDEELMSAVGAFSLDQLMELAGLACAQALATVYRKDTHSRVLVCCGPGNQGLFFALLSERVLLTGPDVQGGDGLVAARHLGMFGYRPIVYMPKPGSKDIYKHLQTQCENMGITIIPPSNDLGPLVEALSNSDVVLDAIFGFSFLPPIRAPFDGVLPILNDAGVPIVSVDIPSGWNVEKGNDLGVGLKSDVLVSLTAPKEGAKDFIGTHFLGGRFVPKSIAEKFQLDLPAYPDFQQIVELESQSKSNRHQY
ncbi:YjeF N-terminal domain-containing protein [Crepidotus variabilis]|uniref:NAD(P)H-hydrate epimerase n=1 Tax=Crepidotus variabilis TaxID=179855 RepID=A0A9P6EDH3_9AGAR|nr:YjeF N-terminal domain-containing protein [Crepidotus variabilis]